MSSSTRSSVCCAASKLTWFSGNSGWAIASSLATASAFKRTRGCGVSGAPESRSKMLLCAKVLLPEPLGPASNHRHGLVTRQPWIVSLDAPHRFATFAILWFLPLARPQPWPSIRFRDFVLLWTSRHAPAQSPPPPFRLAAERPGRLRIRRVRPHRVLPRPALRQVFETLWRGYLISSFSYPNAIIQ